MIGIGISTTPNRTILQKTLPEWERYLPPNSRLIVENDIDFSGVAATKNRLLAKLDDCDDIFLIDDDVLPLRKGWEIPYITSGYNHLMYQFRLSNKSKRDMLELYRDDKIVSYSHTRGPFIYIKLNVLSVVGGFDIAYNRYGFEHPDFTNRIHNAGLTPHRAMDVIGSNKLLYCFDQDTQLKSSVSDRIKVDSKRRNYQLYRKNRNSKAYKEYR